MTWSRLSYIVLKPFHLTITAPNLTKFTSLNTADFCAPGGYKIMANGYELHTEYYSACENESKLDSRGEKSISAQSAILVN